jgi:glutamyl-tRNA reductase
MNLLVVGLNHRTAPVELLGRATVSGTDLPTVLAGLLAADDMAEVAVLSTCNRVEIIAAATGFHGALDHIGGYLADRVGTDFAALADHLYVHYADDAVRHVFTVAAGLGSMVLGEAQILGQVRDAYAAADSHAAIGRTLHELFQQALRVGKRVHAETAIDHAGRTVVTAALDLGEAAIGGLAGRRALIIGTGSMGSLAGATLRRAGIGSVVLASRTPENATRLAESLDADVAGPGELPEVLAGVDVVVCATTSTTAVLDATTVVEAQRRRNGRPLLVLDLAVPRDVEDRVRRIPGVTLVDVEGLGSALSSADPIGARERRAAGGRAVEGVGEAYAILVEESQAFLNRQRQTGVAPTVVALRAKADEVVAAELARLTTKLPDLDRVTRAEVERTVRRVVSNLLHLPTVRVKELAGEPGGDRYAVALRELFDLDVNGIPASASTSAGARSAGARSAGARSAGAPPVPIGVVDGEES